jgi:predicted ATPase
MKIPIKHINIKGYKSIKGAEVSLSSINLLIGQNGAGKSNFLQLFGFLRAIYDQSLQMRSIQAGGANTLVYNGTKETQEIAIDLQFDQSTYEVNLGKTATDSLFVMSETLTTKRNDHLASDTLTLATNHPESNLKTYYLGQGTTEEDLQNRIDGATLNSVRTVMCELLVYHFNDTSVDARVKRTGKIYDNVFLQPDGSNLAAVLLSISEDSPMDYRRIIQNIQLCLPMFDDFYLKPNGDQNENILLRWTAKNSSSVFGANALSDGSIRFICLTVLLMQPNLPKVLLIDEPELGLHPAAIGILAAMLSRAALQSQLIISTQSPALVSEFEAQDIIVVERAIDGGSTFKRLDAHNLDVWLEDFSLGDIWTKNLIGGNP